jgi:hypothetical protein
MGIFVTNNSDQDLKDGFGGVFYDFKIGSTIEIPEEAAKHIFGYNNPDKQHYLARLGWAKTTNDLADGLDRLAKWDLSTTPPEKNQSLSPLVERVPLPSQKKAGGKVLKAVA